MAKQNVKLELTWIGKENRPKLEAQKCIKALESTRNQKRRELFDAQDAIDLQRDGLIGKIESQMRQRHNMQPLFTLRLMLI